MTAFLNALQFGTPLALWGLIALPIIWWSVALYPAAPQADKIPTHPHPARLAHARGNTGQDAPGGCCFCVSVLPPSSSAQWRNLSFSPRALTCCPPATASVIIVTAGNPPSWAARRDFLIDVLEQARVEGAPVTLLGTAPQEWPHLPYCHARPRSAGTSPHHEALRLVIRSHGARRKAESCRPAITHRHHLAGRRH